MIGYGIMSRQNWKHSEVAFLTANISILGIDGCAEALFRPLKSVWCKAQKLGILLGDTRWWSKEKMQVLSRNFSSMQADELASLLNMSVSSIYHKAQRMKLKSSNWWTEKENAFLKANYGTISSKEIGEVVGRTGISVRSQAGRLNLTKQNYYPEERYCADRGKKLVNKYMSPIHCSDCAPNHKTGENNAMWKNGVSTLRQVVDRFLRYIWREPILKRDKRQCRLCGSMEFPEVHHILPFVVIRDKVIAENPTIDIADYEERVKLAHLIAERHVLENGITLCQSCHKFYHAEKRDELSGNSPSGDNQQPSLSNVIQFVDRTVQRLTVEDTQTNKTDTSVPLAASNSKMI